MTQPEGADQTRLDATLEQLLTNAARLGLTWTLRPGTVSYSNTVITDGDNIALTVVSLIGVINFDQRVMVASVPDGGNYIIGVLGQARGLIAESYRDTTVGTFTTNETVIQEVSFNALAGVRYEVMAVQNYQSTVVNDLVQMRLRWKRDTALATDGDEIHSVITNCDIAGRSNPGVLLRTFTPGAGLVSVGVTAVRQNGTGNISMFGNAAQVNSLVVKAI